MPHRITSTEYTRLAALYRYGLLGGTADPAIDAVVQDLAASLGMPVAQFALADAARFSAASSVGPVARDCPRGGTLADLVISDHPRLLVADTEVDGRPVGDAPLSDLPLRSYAAIRIATPEDDAIGVLHVADTRPRALTAGEAAAIEAAAHTLAGLLEGHRRARLDVETGALDSDAFAECVRHMAAAARHGRQRISLVRLDLEGFRTSLEAMGVGLGRIVLHRMADLGLRQVRRRDCFGRVAHDVFAVLLTDTGEAGARVLADRLSRHLSQGWSESMPHTEPVAIAITSVKPVDAADAEAALLAAAAGPRASAEAPPRLARSA